MQKLLEGSIVGIIFRNEENGYTVARLKANDNSQSIITGILMGVQIGERLKCNGTWKNDKKYGLQFNVETYEVQLPDDNDGIIQYLSSGQISGIGDVYAKRIVDKFGLDTFKVLNENPIRLLEIEGIGKKKLERITYSWREQQDSREIVLFLQKFGIAAQFAQKIFKIYGEQSIEKVTENPYSLSDDMVGVGFKRSDILAAQLGIESDDNIRIDAGLIYIMKEINAKGHTCFPLNSFLSEASSMLNIAAEKLENGVGRLISSGKFHVDSFNTGESEYECFIWNKYLYNQELNIIERLKRLQISDNHIFKNTNPEDESSASAQKMGIALAFEQRRAVEKSLIDKIHIITGGPGTGKSTITRVILDILLQHSDKVFLAAPTGRAAKRMSEICGREATTIHSLLSINAFSDSIRSHSSHKLSADAIIIDEVSMIDCQLMSILLDAVPDHCKLILIGDVDQLPSVGPGNVLRDLLDSGLVPSTRLKEIFRQSANSKIITNAHKINNGFYPDLSIEKNSDFFFIQEKEPDKISDIVVGLLSDRLKKTYHFNPFKDIQVLTPLHKGIIGTQELNSVLQKALNPIDDKREFVQKVNLVFCQGDKVMQIRNNYKKNVFNGDIGFIKKIKTIDKLFIVEFDSEREVEYEFNEINELEHAYAVSIHKFQGSEAPCVVIPIHESQNIMLYRNLIYTAITRGKKLIVMVGSREALKKAIFNHNKRERYSGLLKMISSEENKALPEIKIIPSLNSEEYENWLVRNNML